MKCKYFAIYELVPKHIYKKRGEKAWELLNPLLLTALDRLKVKFNKGTMTINNYYWGGTYNYSGLRTPESEDYSETSQHTVGNGVDVKFSDYDTDEVRQYIIDNPDEFPEIKGIELEVAWLHIDVRNSEVIKVFKP
jgi:hypothetical protein